MNRGWLRRRAVRVVAGSPEGRPAPRATGAGDGASRGHPRRTARSLCLVVAVVLATLVLPAQTLAHAGSSSAGFVQATAQCWPGPSGNACARLFYNSATRTWRAYGATDPNPGRYVGLGPVFLFLCTTPTSGCRVVSRKTPRADSDYTVYQRLTADAQGPACYWKTQISYVAAGRSYTRDSPVGGLC